MLSRLDIKYFKLAVGLDSIGTETDVDISARCPICGDSRKNKNSKRLHLYTKGSYTGVNCFNGDCACQNKTVYSFLRDFFPSLLPNYKRENFSNTMEKLANGDSEDVFAQFKQKEEKKDILKHDLSPYFKDISECLEALEYIKSRGHTYDESKYGKWFFGYQDLKIGEKLYKLTNAVIIPLYYDGDMYGFYSRNIFEKTFFTYMPEHNVGYKIWNWFNIDKKKPVYIFEGIFDAISGGIENSIALMGAKIPEERLKELSQPVFVLDNDITGLKNSLNYSKKGYSVYIQPADITDKDMNGVLLNNVEKPSELIRKNVFSGISAEVRIKQLL
jgi:hypothetical protein